MPAPNATVAYVHAFAYANAIAIAAAIASAYVHAYVHAYVNGFTSRQRLIPTAMPAHPGPRPLTTVRDMLETIMRELLAARDEIGRNRRVEHALGQATQALEIVDGLDATDAQIEGALRERFGFQPFRKPPKAKTQRVR